MNEENILILQKAIHKAEANGWKNPFATKQFQISKIVWGAAIPAIIYRHDFAKALWGTKKINTHIDKPIGMTDYEFDALIYKSSQYADVAWKYHLQQMVVAKNPMKYLKQYVE